jgi:hypothetical protein
MENMSLQEILVYTTNKQAHLKQALTPVLTCLFKRLDQHKEHCAGLLPSKEILREIFSSFVLHYR